MYKFKTKPFSHQKTVFEQSRDREYFAILWEQGTGKTKVSIDTAAYLFLKGEINGLLVVAPNTVHRNWADQEIPTHMPDLAMSKSRIYCWHSKRSKSKTHTKETELLLAHEGLAILCVSYDATMTKAGKEYIEKFLKRKSTLMILDESARIKSPKAKRTRAICTLGKKAKYRRILTGTPITQGPFDAYPQIKFLDDSFWKERNLHPFTVFKTHFAQWGEGYNGATGKKFPILVCYRHLDQLHDLMKNISSRVTKDEVLDLPPKLYTSLKFELSPEQRRLYQELCDEYTTQLDTGELVDAPLALVRLLRLQQITSGYVWAEEITEKGTLEGKVREISGDNPRLETLCEVVEDLSHKAIIWCTFQKDVDQVKQALTQRGRKVVTFDGRTNTKDREAAIQSFQNGDAEFFLSNPAAAGEGLTLHASRTVIYYSNSFKLSERLQSEDRAHRIGQNHPVQYIDLMADNTVDEKIVSALQKKHDIASMITGDRFRKWL